jgi:phosphonopyruvate decarboxylase
VIDPATFVSWLDSCGVSMYAGVPDSLLKELGRYLADGLPPDRHVITANEGAAVALAMGHYLRSGEPAAVYMQNSGFGNSINPLLSLADRAVYGIPMVLIVGWRGQPGVKDEPQHVTQGRVQEDLLRALDIPYRVLPQESQAAEATVRAAVAETIKRQTPYVLLVEKDTFSTALSEQVVTWLGTVSREDALCELATVIGYNQIIVATTGMLSRELFEFRVRNGTDASLDFLSVGGMGHASSIALGVDLVEDEREVWCIDGDGALLMHMGAMALIAERGSEYFFHVVVNNGVHDSVGGQPTAIETIDIPAVAMACGYRWAKATDQIEHIAGLVAEMRSSGGPALLEVRVRPGARPDLGRPTRTPAESRDAFCEAVRPK